MIMQLADNWRINIQDLNWEVQERVEGKDREGNPKLHWKFRGYYSGMNSALASLPDHLALSPSIEDWQQYLEEWDAMRKQITERFRK